MERNAWHPRLFCTRGTSGTVDVPGDVTHRSKRMRERLPRHLLLLVRVSTRKGARSPHAGLWSRAIARRERGAQLRRRYAMVARYALSGASDAARSAGARCSVSFFHHVAHNVLFTVCDAIVQPLGDLLVTEPSRRSARSLRVSRRVMRTSTSVRASSGPSAAFAAIHAKRADSAIGGGKTFLPPATDRIVAINSSKLASCWSWEAGHACVDELADLLVHGEEVHHDDLRVGMFLGEHARHAEAVVVAQADAARAGAHVALRLQ